jgi:hypothetical protein
MYIYISIDPVSSTNYSYASLMLGITQAKNKGHHLLDVACALKTPPSAK